MTAITKQSPEVVARRQELAQQMLELGAYVFPLANGSKQPLVPKAKGGKGFLDAKPDPVMARTFLGNAGQPNYGVVFPDDSDVLILDLDGGDREKRPDWREDWQRQYDLYGPPGLTFIVRTPSGGRHAYYRWRTDLYGPMPAGDELLGWTVRKPWKGYLVGPGSVVNDQVYELAGADAIADLPESWVRAALAEQGGRTKPAADRPFVTIKGPAAVQAGHRHKYLRDQARYLVGIGLTGEALYTAVADLNRQMPEPKTEEEVRRAIGDAESKFEPDEITAEGEPARPARATRVYAEDVELAMPAIQPFPTGPADIAFVGLAGEAIESLESLTSASRVGMLTVLLSAWGGLFGTRGMYHGEQPSVVFAVLIGETGRARKGTTTSAVWTALVHALTSGFVSVPIGSSRWDGLASGEALVRILADAKGGDQAKPVYGLIVEEEFERLLRRMRSSDGYQSTLDTYLRQAFDARMIQHVTAAKTVRVQPPYGVSIVGNVTRETLRQNVSPDMARSGFANRFLWMPIAERDVDIAGNVPWRFAGGIQAALQDARAAWVGGSTVELEPAALDLLNDYGQHLRDLPGMVGAMGARLHVIASRVALIHAALDRSAQIGVDLVDRAIALTEYARSGLRWSFRDDLGDEDANALYSACLAAVPDGLSTRSAQAVIGRSGRFMKARDLLLENQYITLHKASTNPQGGRPAIMLRAVDDRGFQGFVPRGRAQRDHESETQETYSRSTNPPKPTTNLPTTATSPDEPTGSLRVVPATPDGIDCHFYAEHQSQHRLVGGRWTCDICSPIEEPAS